MTEEYIKTLPASKICVRFNCGGKILLVDDHPNHYYCRNCGQLYKGVKDGR